MLTEMTCCYGIHMGATRGGDGGNMTPTFYSAAALHAMQSAVIPTAIPSVRLSVRLSVCHTLVPYPDE